MILYLSISVSYLLLIGQVLAADTQKKCGQKADILFIVDASGSIGDVAFHKMRQFMANLTSNFNVSQDAVHFSELVFSDNNHLEFNFNKYTNNAAVKQALMNTKYYGGWTYTGAALKYAKEYAFTVANGARVNVPKIAVVLTDGGSTDSNVTPSAADQLKKSGVSVIVIGVGSNVNQIELDRIATSSKVVFFVDHFDGLSAIENSVAYTTCEVQKAHDCISCSCQGKEDGDYPACSPECEKGYYYHCSAGSAKKMECDLAWYVDAYKNHYAARMVYNPSSGTCELKSDSCPRNSTSGIPEPSNTESQCEGKADILLILDASGSIGDSDFTKMLQFVADLTSNFLVSSNTIHFSELVYSTTYHLEFGFNKYLNNAALRLALLNTTYYSGQTYTGAALRHARTFAFKNDNGARSNVPKIAVVLTDGASTDSEDTLKEADNLKKSGVSVLVIGVGPVVNQKELQKIATSSQHVFNVDNFDALVTIKNNVAYTACDTQKIHDCVSSSCLGRKDGDYPACSPLCQEGVYFSCVAELTNQKDCDLGLYFNSNNERYTAKKVYNPPTKSCELQSDFCPRGSPVIAKTTQCIVNCIGRPDGNYAACSPLCEDGYYYSCVAEYAYTMPCALGWYTDESGNRFTQRMVYDPLTDRCLETSISCPRKIARPLPTTTPPPVIPDYNPFRCVKTQCEGFPDGTYPLCNSTKCDDSYITCQNQKKYEQKCSGSSVFDFNGKKCIAKPRNC